MKQTAVEWLEEIYLTTGIDRNVHFNQAKVMSEEQMIKFAEFVATYPDKNKNAKGDILHAKSKYDGAERTVDLLEIFKQQDL